MEKSKQFNPELAKELIQWSKWMISVNFLAGSGCVAVLRDIKSQGTANVSVWLLIAIALFACCILCSVTFNLILSMEVGAEFTLKKKHKFLAGLQLALFTLALISLFSWVNA